MRNLRCLAVASALLCAVAAVAGADGETGDLEVVEILVGTALDREDRVPRDVGDVFPAGTEKLWCWTRVRGAAGPTDVVHVWYHEGGTRARVVLPVRSPDWRTWSSKRLLSAWTGRWEVKVLDADGLVLAATRFIVGNAMTDGEDTE